MTALPSRIWTVPVAPTADTVPLRLTVWPNVAGFGDAVRLVVVVRSTWAIVVPELAAYAASPL